MRQGMAAGVYSSASPRSDVTVPGKWTEDFQALSDNGVAFPPVTLGSISQAMIDSIAKVLQEGMTPQAAAEWLPMQSTLLWKSPAS